MGHGAPKTEEADRSGSGPGSSHQGGSHGHASRKEEHVEPGAPTNRPQSQVGTGGGERDSHHTHDPKSKGDRTGY
ncbi:hypothetical protein [Roseomonas sp. BN140053]|uniref:hypothetical protein n=1 Tax=Roseomonas sp. BN140053 TaxID=3391898 RepID=UPI0039E9CC64